MHPRQMQMNLNHFRAARKSKSKLKKSFCGSRYKSFHLSKLLGGWFMESSKYKAKKLSVTRIRFVSGDDAHGSLSTNGHPSYKTRFLSPTPGSTSTISPSYLRSYIKPSIKVPNPNLHDSFKKPRVGPILIGYSLHSCMTTPPWSQMPPSVS